MSVTVSGGDKLQSALKQIVKSARAKARDQVKLSALRVSTEMYEKAPLAFGGIKRGITVAFEKQGLTAVIKSTAKYSLFVEGLLSNGQYGRKPGRAPPYEAIKRWVLLKDLDKKWSMSVDSATFLVRRKIAKKGTRAQPFFVPAFVRELPVFEAAVNRIIEDAARGVESARGAFA